jgi:hypothetical protein
MALPLACAHPCGGPMAIPMPLALSSEPSPGLNDRDLLLVDESVKKALDGLALWLYNLENVQVHYGETTLY